MKVILLQDVAKIGTRFTVAEVADGYALNQLIPKGLAEPATVQNLKKLASRNATVEATKASDAEEFAAAKAVLENTPLTVTVEANELGHMFGALKPAEIVAAAKEAGATINESQLSIQTPIKEAGEHTVTLTGGDDSTTVHITVVPK